MKIAVVILNWNGKHLLEKFLPSVVAYSQEADIYVIDNASSDDSISYLTYHFPDVQLIRNPLNGGYAQGYNWGLTKISADVYCLLNSDIEVTEDWLLPVKNIFKNSEIGAVQPKILDYKNKKMFEYAGAAGGFIDKYGFPFCRGRIFETIEEDYGQYNSQTDIFWASGACLFVRSEVFNQVKGFDEDFFAHQEEIDLCWRIHHLNKRVVFCSESIVYHVGGATLPVDSPKKTFLNFRNGLFMLLKNLPQENLYKTLFIRLIFDGIAGIRFLLQGKIWFTWAIFKAHMNFYHNFLKFKNKRPKHTFSSYYNTKSIVWLYFVKNKKFFSDFH